MNRLAKLLCLLLFVSVAALPAAAATPTVSDLVVTIANANGLQPADGAEAVSQLRGLGANLPVLDLSAPLTERNVVLVSSAFGVRVTTQRPADRFSSGEMRQLVSAFGDQFNLGPDGGSDDNATQGGGNGADPRTKGKGKKKGLFRSPSEPQK
jgi:hypothetical protein